MHLAIIPTVVPLPWSGKPVYDWFIGDRFDPFMATNGVLGGLVAITAGSPMVETEGAFVIGVLSGVLVFYGNSWLIKMKVW